MDVLVQKYMMIITQYSKVERKEKQREDLLILNGCKNKMYRFLFYSIIQMVAGMGGLSQGFVDLADGQDRAQMMNPAAIMGNLEHGNMIIGP